MMQIHASGSKSENLSRSWLNGPYARCVMTDRERLISVLRIVDADPTFLLIEGEPRSKARPTNNDNSKQDRQNRDLKESLRINFPRLLTGNVAVCCFFYRSSRKRIDIDNLFKEVFDAANGIVWRDDMQVTACLGFLSLDKDYPRTALAIGPLRGESSLDRTEDRKPCQHCGESFSYARPAHGLERKFCSRECVGMARRGIDPRSLR